MNSRFKFRAWDKGLERMISPHNGDFIMWHAPSNWANCYEVMQFTGLFDVHGKPIYEGDIVNWLGHEVAAGRQIRPKRQIVVGETNYILDCFHLQNLIGHGDKSVEIIGNVWENPELLAEDKEKP